MTPRDGLPVPSGQGRIYLLAECRFLLVMSALLHHAAMANCLRQTLDCFSGARPLNGADAIPLISFSVGIAAFRSASE